MAGKGGGFQLDMAAFAEVPQSYSIGVTGRELEFRAFHFADGALYLKNSDRLLGTVTADDIDLDTKQVIGKGASGTVYFARLKASGRAVAVKAIPISSKPHRDEVERELMFLAPHGQPQCPHVIHSYGAWWEPHEEAVYMCMDYMAYSMAQLAGFGDGLPESIVRDAILQTVLGLQHLHEVRRVIHRDIKPGNLLADFDGTIKISDFGISKVVQTFAASSTYIGTLLFMGPERLDEGSYSFPSDIWSLGLTAVSLATAKQPWYPPEELNLYELLQRMTDAGATPRFPANFSAAAQDFVAQCLQRDPEARPTCAALLKHPWLAGASVDDAKLNIRLFVEHVTRLVQQGSKQNRSVEKSAAEIDAEKERLIASSLDGLLE